MSQNTPSLRQGQRGSGLIVTLILVGVVSVVITWALRYSIGEMPIKHRQKLKAQASNVAGTIVGYGCFQLSSLFDTTTVTSSSFITASSDTLELPPKASLPSNVDYANSKLYSNVVPSSSFVYIDPRVPENQTDPLKGNFVRAFEVDIYGKAIVTDPNGGPSSTAYVSQTLQVRDSPLFFSKEILFDFDRDDDPGSMMQIVGLTYGIRKSTEEQLDSVNASRAIIEPPLPASSPSYVEQIENQKMSRKAGLYFRWDTTSDTLHAYNRAGSPLGIDELEGTLWRIKDGAGIENRLYDSRRGDFVTTVDFHAGKLKQLIENPDTSDAALHIGGYDPTSDWNGIVYLQSYSSDPNVSAAEALNTTGIRLYKGETDVVGEGIPSRGSDPGMSFVTNNALYLQGHFNADGETSSDSSYCPEAGEVPVALMGDSITFLSENWADSGTGLRSKAVATEVSAAIVSGFRMGEIHGAEPSIAEPHDYSGFLEDWSNGAFYLRGSLVYLYQCTVDVSNLKPPYTNHPNREYGFNELFKSGSHPPGTPLLRTYRRSDIRNLTAPEFASKTLGL